MTSFIETEEQQALRKAVAAMASNYGQDYYLEKARAGEHTDDIGHRAPRARRRRGVATYHRPRRLGNADARVGDGAEHPRRSRRR